MKEKLVTFLAENSETVKDSAEKVNDFFSYYFSIYTGIFETN